MKIVFTNTALDDLDSIYYFREQPTAKKLVKSILEEIKLLELYPEAAPIDDLFIDQIKTIRSLVVAKGQYKVLFFIETDFVFISKIWDCRQNTESYSINYEQ
ncbi:type II toxin-antitoxin system RelE/ParE family toxin [Bacteroidales bacterium OttesenSCG-928-A17]|nr:type II toxin-antitoxin system RelE/ParE family toxin [Bacteroidales bacterium OttesenSCG-928-A17]